MNNSTTGAGDTLDRMIAIYDVVMDTCGEWFSIAELHKNLSIPKSSLHRYLATLERKGIVEHDGSRYCLTERALEKIETIGLRIASKRYRRRFA